MLKTFEHRDPEEPVETLSKANEGKEVQLIPVMSRNADLYLLDEPIKVSIRAAKSIIFQIPYYRITMNSSIIISPI